jgi:hypothetical protein
VSAATEELDRLAAKLGRPSSALSAFKHLTPAGAPRERRDRRDPGQAAPHGAEVHGSTVSLILSGAAPSEPAAYARHVVAVRLAELPH